jgi:hypothetical protein
MPCKTGYRESIEERKRQNREQRERMLTDPHRKDRVSLMERIRRSPRGFDGLSHPQKLYFAVRLLEGTFTTVDFTNTSSTTRAHTILMLKRVSSRSAHSRRSNHDGRFVEGAAGERRDKMENNVPRTLSGSTKAMMNH